MNKKYEQLYQQIELQQGQAFQFSNPLQVQFKQPTQIKPNLFSTILSYVNYAKQNKNEMLQKLLIPLPNQFFLMAYGNAIRIYKHWQTEQQEIKCQILSQILVNFNIKQVKVSPFSKCKKGKDFYFVVEDISSRYLAVLHYDALQHQIKSAVPQRIQSKINCWSYIENKQILIWCQNMKIYHYQLKQNALRLIHSVDTHIDIVNQQFTVKQIEKPKSRSKYKWNKQQEPVKKKQKNLFSLNFCCIIGQRQKEQDSTIVLFYVLYNQQLNAMKIKCKQILYPFENQSSQSVYTFLHPKNQFPYLKVQTQNYQIVSHNTANPQILKALNIIKIQQAYLITFQFQIIVVQKKFNQYFAVNNIYKKNKDCLVSMAYNSNVVSCITDKILQLNRITITQNKISSQMIDFIDLELQYKRLSEIISKNFSVNQNAIKIGAFDKHEGKLLELWISTDLYNQKHRKNIFFVFQVAYTQNKTMKKAYFFYVTQHGPRIKKITTLAHKASKPQDIVNIERLGKQLGISQSQFYYNMWKTSKKGSDQITRYLLKCKDYKRILTQLRGFLRRKSFNATKLLKVLQKLQQVTLELLKQKLNEQNLVIYFHVVFLHRKFQVFQSNYIIDDQEFSQMSQISLVQLVYKIINCVISPDVKNTSVWAMQTKQPAKLYLIQVLNLFKFPLLQEYDLFLRSILMNYPSRIPQVIDNFPQLLPNYPLQQIQIFPVNTQRNQTTLPKSQLINQKQKQLFSSIKQQDLKNQKNFLQHTFNQIYPIYSTSIILKIFEQAIGINQFKNKKYTFHTAIQSYYEEYKKNIKNVSKFDGKYLYIVVLNCLIKSNYLLRKQRKQNLKNQYKIQLQLNSYSEMPSQYYQQIYQINDSQIDDLIAVYRQKYKIDQAVLQQLRIISYIYQLMINKQIIDAQQLNLQDIFAQPIQKWVALFFLGNKQQKDLIFNDFMTIFKKNKNKFQQFLNQYIISQHCSKIELSILVDLIDQNGEQFQKENQKIIQIIFDGYCTRILVEDVRDADHFRQRISKIVLEKQLLKKADKISKINICYPILHNFYMEGTIVKDLLDNPISIFTQIIDSFFSQNIRNNYIKLPQSYAPKYQLKIQQIKDMFNLIYFLRENVFVEISGNQLVIAYCKVLIQWQQFDQITYVLQHQQKIKSYKLNIQQIVMRVQKDVLDVLYGLDGFCLTQQNKYYVNNILNISTAVNKNQKQQKISKLVSQNRSIIIISDILTKWQQKQIPISLINNLCEQWIKMYSQPLNFQLKSYKNCVMYRIIQKYSIYMDLQSMKKIYEQFINILKCNINYNDVHHQDYYRYCNFLCDRLIINNNFREAAKVVCVINKMFQFNYMLMAETMLLSIISIYLNVIPENDDSQIKINDESCEIPQSSSHQNLGKVFYSVQNNQKHTQKLDKKPLMLLQNQDFSIYSQKYQPTLPGIQITKLYINYFIAHWHDQDQQSLKLLYQTYFNIQQDQLQKYQQIVINSQLTYDRMNKNINTDILWNFVKKACEKHKLEQIDIVFGYFFMQMGLTIPDLGFSEVDYISYTPSSLVTILYQFMIQCNNNNIYNFLDYSKIFTRYIDSLTKLLLIQHQSQIFNTNDQQYNNNKFNIYQLHKNANLHFVRQEILKNKEYLNDPLTIQINRMKTITQEALKNNNKRMLDFKIQHSTVSNFNLLANNRLKRTLGKTFRRQKSPQSIQKIPGNRQDQQDKMMSFEKFKSLKNRIKTAKKLEDLNVSERDIIQQIFNQTDQNKKQKERQIIRLKQVVKNVKMEYKSKEKSHLQNLMKSFYEEQNNKIQKSNSQYILKGLLQ